MKMYIEIISGHLNYMKQISDELKQNPEDKQVGGVRMISSLSK